LASDLVLSIGPPPGARRPASGQGANLFDLLARCVLRILPVIQELHFSNVHLGWAIWPRRSKAAPVADYPNEEA